jgi:hypothetical protein
MSEERKSRSVWPWIIALLVGMPVLYVASFGPACLFVDRDMLPMSNLKMVFSPCVELALEGPEPIKSVLWSWADICGGGVTLRNLVAERVLEQETRP